MAAAPASALMEPGRCQRVPRGTPGPSRVSSELGFGWSWGMWGTARCARPASAPYTTPAGSLPSSSERCLPTPCRLSEHILHFQVNGGAAGLLQLLMCPMQVAASGLIVYAPLLSAARYGHCTTPESCCLEGPVPADEVSGRPACLLNGTISVSEAR